MGRSIKSHTQVDRLTLQNTVQMNLNDDVFK